MASSDHVSAGHRTTVDPHDFPDGVIRIRRDGDTEDRIQILESGVIKTGDGSSAPSSTGGPGVFVPVSSSYAAAGTDVLASKVSGDAANRFVVNADGKLEWGDGTAALDTNFYRAGAGVLKSDSSIVAKESIAVGAGGGLAPVAGVAVAVAAHTTASIRVSANGNTTTPGGGILFGDDTNLYRSAADTLKTDDALIVGGRITVSGGVQTDDTDPGTTLGSVVRSLPIYSAAGVLLGYLPIYDAIT